MPPGADDVRREVREIKDKSSRNDRKKGKASAMKQGELQKPQYRCRGQSTQILDGLSPKRDCSSKRVKRYTGVNRRDRNYQIFARPNGVLENTLKL